MKILVGISGGVDSSFAAYKLISEGHTVEGATLVMHEYTELDSAREAAGSLGIPLHEIDCREDFDNIIKTNFVSEYMLGRTPNPCIICNERIKFHKLLEFALAQGFDAIATGHYARIVTVSEEGRVRHAVAMATDSKKDQTYMLYRLPERILSKLILPLSDMKKEDIRLEALKAGISSANRPDSQEICFLPDGGHAEYIESVKGKSPEGDFVSPEGELLGRHKGIIRYTVGQRKGLGIALGKRAFVTAIDPVNNTVTLSSELNGKSSLTVSDVVYTGLDEPRESRSVKAFVKLRYTAPLIPCEVTLARDGTLSVSLDSPAKFAPGQSAVFYKDGVVLFGGFID